MNHFDAVIARGFELSHWSLEYLRTLPTDAILASLAWTTLASLVEFAAALKRRAKLREELKSTREELEETRARYEKEVRWRVAGENILAQHPSRRTR